MAQEDFNEFVERVKQAESRGRRHDKSGNLLTSPKGAQGEMQVMPGTQTDPGFGVTPAKPGDAEDIARVGRDYLAAMDKRYGGNRMYAAVAYNWGPGNADKWIKGGADFSKLPAETQAYVQSVTGGAPQPSQAPKASQAVAQAPSPRTTPATDMGVGYQAALALSFLDDKDNEDDDEKAVAKLDEEEDTQAAKMLAEYKPFNALADLDLTSTAPKQFQKGGEAKAEEVPTPMLFSVPTYAETVSHEMYPGQGGQFDQKDAARHMLAAGTLARKYGENAAEILGKAHEITTSPLRWVGSKLGISQMPVDYEQDLHNNRVGIELAKRSKSQKDLEDLINAEAERAKSQQTPGAAWVGKPVRRANGSPETAEEVETMEQKATQGGYGNTIPPTRSAQQLQAYMESMNPTVQVSERPMEPGLLGYVQSDKILRNMGAPNVLHINTEQSPGNAEITKLHELEHALDLRGGDIKGRPDVRYSDNTMRAYYLMGNKWGPISQTVQNMVNNKEKLEKFFGRPIESGYFHPESLKNLLAVGNETALFKEQLATLSALEQVTGKSLTQDRDMRELFPNTRMMAVYDALTGPRQTRMDARDLPPHTPVPSYTYETNALNRFIRQHISPKQEYGIPIKRADGSPESGERALTAEEIEAASKPAFLTPKSGIGRKISTTPGQIEGAVAQGVSETPYNLVGAPVDIATMVMRPFGYSVDKPVMGSDWIKEKMSAAGVRPQPPSDPTSRAFYEAGQLGGGVINPTAPVRGTVAAAQKTGEAAKMLARDFQQYNQQLAVPGASYAVRPQQGGHFVYNTYSKEDEVDHFLRVSAGVANFQNDPLSNWMRKRFGNYMRGTMGTEADPLVKAADNGKQLHFMDEHGMSYESPNSVNLQWLRPQMGLPKEGFAKTEAGKAAEAAIDSSIVPLPIKEVMPNYRTPKMEELANKDPEAPVYQLDHEELDDALKPESLKIALRNMLEETWLPPELRITPEQLQKMTLVEASEKANKFEKFIQAKEAQDLMKGSASVPVFKKYDDGYNWFLPQDVKEDPLAKQFVLKAGNNARWCTEKEGHCLAYASGRKNVMVLVSPKGNPRVQLAMEKSDELDMAYDWLQTLSPENRKSLQDNYYMHQLTELPQFKQWARSTPDTEILEIKGRFNSDELKGDDLKKTQDLIRSGNWLSVRELKNAKLTDAYTLPEKYGNPEDIINRFGTRYLTDDELFQITPKEKATGGMIERRTDDTRRYL